LPTYEYRCKACSQELEVVQSFTDDALTTCESCGGQLRKLFGNVGIAFKGSGFYKNDSRGKPASTAVATDKGGSDKASSDKSGSDKSGSDKSGSDKSGSDKSGSDKSSSDSGSNGTKGAGSTSKSASTTSTPAKKAAVGSSKS